MKQRVQPGGTLDIATPEEIGAILARSFELQFVAEYERKKGVIQLDATGAGQSNPAQALSVSAQYDWLMERVTLGGGVNAANATVAFFENQASDSDLLEIVALGTAGRYSDSFSNCLYITANSALLIVVTGGPPNGQVTFNLQIKLKQHPHR